MKKRIHKSSIINRKSNIKGLILRLILVILVMGTLLFLMNKHPKSSEAGWYNDSWLYRKKLTFDNSAQAENLTNFTVMVKLTSSNFGFTQAQTNGQDIRFTDSDGTTLLSYEIESYNSTAQTATIWVNVPQIDSSSSVDNIYLYWGNPGASDAQNADSTWPSQYKGVYHLSDNSASTTVLDSSGNNNSITASENTDSGFYQSNSQISGGALTLGTPGYIPNPYGTNISELYPDVALDSNGYPVIAYFDDNNDDLVVVHCNDRECKGNNENINVVDSSGSTGYYPSILLDSSGYPMIAYLYNSSSDLKYVHCNDINCAGGDETFSSIDTANTTGYYPKMVLDSLGYPVIVYYYATGADLKLTHCGNANCNSGNTTSTIDSGGTVGNNLHGSDIVLDSLGYPVISYYDTTNTELKVVHCDDANCAGGDEATYSPLSTLSKSLGSFTAIELDGSGLPMISYYNATDANLEFIHCNDATCAGDESAQRVIIETGGSYQYQSMEKNSSGIPIIAANNGAYPRIFACANTNCSSNTATYLTLYNQYGGSYPNFRMDASNNIALVAYNRGKTGIYDSVIYTTKHKLEQAYDSDFDFGTGSFSVSAWFKSNGYAEQNTVLSRYDADQGFKIYTNYAGRMCFGIDDDSSWSPDDSACSSNSQINTNVDNGNGGSVNWHAMVLDSSGYPVIAYFDDTPDDLEIIHCNDANCSGGNENYASIDQTGDIGRSPSIVLDGSGYPVIAYHDNTNNDLKLVHCGNANCSSGNTINTVDNSADDVGDYPTVKLDGSGFPVIAYYDTTNTAVKLAHCNDVNCTGGNESIVTLVNDEDDRVRHGSESLQLDASGYPMVVYFDNTNGDLKYIHCNDANCDGAGETKTTVESTNWVGDFASMTKDSNDYPVIAHYDGSYLGLRVVYCGNVDCSSGNSINAVNSINSGDAGYYGLNIKLNSDGYPVILSSSLAHFSTVLTVCNDFYCAGGDETNSIIREGTYNYVYHSLAFDSNSYPVISYARDGWDLSLIHLDNTTTYTETGNYDDNSWHHLVAVKNGTTSITLYIDGVSVGTDTSLGASGTLTSNSATLNLTEEITNTLSTNNWTGYFDEVQISNTTRSASWAAAQYKSENNTFITTGVTENDPIAYWRFDEGGGSTTYDEMRLNNGSLGIGSSAPSWVDGAQPNSNQKPMGKALFFDGSNDYVSIPDPTNNSLDFSDTADFSLSVWIKRNTSTTADVIIAKRNGLTAGDTGYLLQLNSSDEVFFEISDGTDEYSLQSSRTIIDNSWHNVIVIFDQDSASNSKIYIDGTEDTGVTKTGTIGNIGSLSNANQLVIGAESDYNSPFDGNIDEVKIYNSVLTSNKVKILFNRNSGVALGAGQKPNIGNSPIGWWKLDDGSNITAIDSSGNQNSGTLTTMDPSSDWVPGKAGRALDFDGIDDYVDIPDSSSFDFGTNNLTLSTWIKTTNSSDDDYVINFDGDFDMYFRVLSTGYVRFYIRDVAGAYAYRDSTTVVNNGNWHHVATTWTGSSDAINIYIDGILTQGTQTTSGTVGSINATTSLRIGDRHSGGNDFTGQLDDIKLYNYVRTLDQIHLDKGGSPITYWKMDEATGSTIYDEMKNVNGTLGVGSSAPSWADGAQPNANQRILGKSLSFDGGDKVTISSSTLHSIIDDATDFTLEAWINPTNVSGNKTIIGSQYSNGMTFYLANNKLVHDMDDSAITSNANLSANNWYHVVATFKGSDASHISSLYINGELDNSAANYAHTIAIAELYIGFEARFNYNFVGKIDEPKIYNYILTADEIKINYNRGSAIVLGAGQNDSDPGSTNLKAWWKLDEGSGITYTYDISGNNNTANLYGMESADWVPGKFGRALDFDGTLEYITADNESNFDFGTGSFSISGWFKNSSSGTYRGLVGKTKDAEGYLVYLNNSNQLCFGIDDDAIWSPNDEACGGAYNDNTWHFFTAVKNTTSSVLLYVDGVQIASVNPITSTGSIDSTVGFSIGYNSSTAYSMWQGQIDSIKVWNTALSQSQIAYEYNQGKPVAHWRFDEKSGTTAYDEMDNNNDGTLTNMDTATDWVAGKFNNSLDFDGINDIVMLNENSSFVLNSNMNGFTLSTWIYPRSDGENNQGIIFMENITRLRVTNESTGTVKITAVVDLTTTDATITTTQAIPINQWSHVVLSWEDDADDELSIYINGNLSQSSTDGSGSLNDHSAGDYQIGSFDGIDVFDGKIDELKFYNYVLTTDQIKVDYNNGSAVGFR